MTIAVAIVGGFVAGVLFGIPAGALYEATEYAVVFAAVGLAITLGFLYAVNGGDTTAVGGGFLGWDTLGMLPGLILGDRMGADAYRTAFGGETA